MRLEFIQVIQHSETLIHLCFFGKGHKFSVIEDTCI